MEVRIGLLLIGSIISVFWVWNGKKYWAVPFLIGLALTIVL